MHAKKEIKKKRMQHINISIKNILYQINESDVVTCVLCGGMVKCRGEKKRVRRASMFGTCQSCCSWYFDVIRYDVWRGWRWR
jgi:hypothetical protein